MHWKLYAFHLFFWLRSFSKWSSPENRNLWSLKLGSINQSNERVEKSDSLDFWFIKFVWLHIAFCIRTRIKKNGWRQSKILWGKWNKKKIKTKTKHKTRKYYKNVVCQENEYKIHFINDGVHKSSRAHANARKWKKNRILRTSHVRLLKRKRAFKSLNFTSPYKNSAHTHIYGMDGSV